MYEVCIFLGVNRQIVSSFVIMQNALAVGETKEIIEKAELTTLKLRVSIPHGIQIMIVTVAIRLVNIWWWFNFIGGVDPGTREDEKVADKLF